MEESLEWSQEFFDDEDREESKVERNDLRPKKNVFRREARADDVEKSLRFSLLIQSSLTLDSLSLFSFKSVFFMCSSLRKEFNHSDPNQTF